MSIFNDFVSFISSSFNWNNEPQQLQASSAPLPSVERPIDKDYAKEAQRCETFALSLHAFHGSLHSSADHAHLLRKFDALAPELKTGIGKALWIACFQPEGDPCFADHFLQRNPRILLDCKNAVGEDLVAQIANHYSRQGQVYRQCSELLQFIRDLKRHSSREAQLELFYRLSEPLRSKLAQRVWLEHGGKQNKEFGYFGYGEDQIKRDPHVLFSGLPPIWESCYHALQSKTHYSLFDGLETYSKMRKVPSAPVTTAISTLFEQTTLSEIPKKRVLMCTAEFPGVASAGGLAPAVGGMARGYGNSVRVVLPKYDVIPSKIAMQEKLKYEIFVHGKVYKVFKAKIEGVRCYFIDCPEHFSVGYNQEGKPNKIYDAKDGLAERKRWLHFQSAVVELAIKMGEKKRNPIEIVHVHDAQTALIPKLIAHRYFSKWKRGETPATVFSVHNNLCTMQFNSHEDREALAEIGLPKENICSFAEGIQSAEMIVPVSQQFAWEFQTERFGNQMQRYTKIAAMQGKVFGVTNGNSEEWNPEKDQQLLQWRTLEGEPIPLAYGLNDSNASLADKWRRQRQELVSYLKAHFKAEFDPHKPIFLYVGRYDSFQKGIDKLPLIAKKVLSFGAQFICIGTDPDERADRILKEMEEESQLHQKKGYLVIRDFKRADGRLHWQQGNTSLEDTTGVPGFGKLLRAAVDIGIFPSIFEPCGLVQGEMHRMGKKTVATNVGGFVDTIFTSGPHANGYRFERFDWDSKEQKRAIKGSIQEATTEAHQAIQALYSKDLEALEPYLEQMRAIMKNALCSTWTKAFDGSPSPIDRYHAIYHRAVKATESRGTIFVDVSPHLTVEQVGDGC